MDIDKNLLKKENVQELEALLAKEEQVECPLYHTFYDGVYMREIHMPKGSLIVGKRHRKKTINILIKGKLLLYDNGGATELEAPYMFESEPLSKKVLYIIEDSIWINVHPTEKTDLKEIEEEFIISEAKYIKGEK